MEYLGPKTSNQVPIKATFRYVKRLKTIIALLLLIEVVVTCCNIVGAFDFPWQFAEGEFILNHGYPAKSVLQAYGEISPDFENEYIVYEFLIAGVHRIVGWIGLCIFFGLLCFFIYLPCLWAFLQSKGRFVLIDLCLFSLAQFIVNMRLAARPELIAESCYVLAGIMLVRWPGLSWNGWQTLALGLVFCVWANAHGSFLLGLIMLGLWYAQLFLFRWRSFFNIGDFAWLRPGLAALFGCAVNPYGLFRFEQPFRLHSLLWGQATSLEMWPVTSGVALLPLTWAAAAILAMVLRIRKRKYYWMIAMLLLLQYLAFCSIRYTMFIGLTLLIVTWDGLMNPRKPTLFPIYPRFFALAKLSFYTCVIIILTWQIWGLFYDKANMIRYYCELTYPKSRIATDSSFSWLMEHPAQSYTLLSPLAAGSWAQMPGINGIHPLLDSGTHRYSNRVNELYYYTLFSPETFRQVLSTLNINAIDIDGSNIYWASILNGDSGWYLAQIKSDSQLYLRGNNQKADGGRELFLKWEYEEEQLRQSDDPPGFSSKRIIRGLKLRPDVDSLKMLEMASDVTWLADPQIVYLQEWLDQVPDGVVAQSLELMGDKSDTSSTGLRILFLLRLRQYQQAEEIAQNWHPVVLNIGYQDLEMLRVEAFIRGGDLRTARKILDSFLPKPRYSLRWAKLCQQVYPYDTETEPENARQLNDLDESSGWKGDLITLLNQNILLLSPAPGLAQPAP